MPRSSLSCTAVMLLAFGCSSGQSQSQPATKTCATPELACGTGATAYCANLDTDIQNCGACGQTCPADRACLGGECVPSCPNGQTYCGSACTDVQTDPDNCGNCANACSTDSVCQAGACGCAQGYVGNGTNCVQPAGGWPMVAPLPTAQSNPASGVINGVLYLVNGSTEIVQAYNPATNTWMMSASQEPYQGMGSATVLNDELYLIGGCGPNGDCRASPNTNVYAFNPDAGTWSQLASLPDIRAWVTAGTLNEMIYAIGGDYQCPDASSSAGFDVCTPQSTVFVYDPTSNMWTTGPSLPEGRTQAATATIGDTLYLVGGATSWDQATSDVYSFDGTTWTQVASMADARLNPAVGVINGMLYVAGGDAGGLAGSNTSDTFPSPLEIDDPATDTWTTGPNLTPRSSTGFGVIDGVFYVAGGTDQLGPLTIVEAYTP